MHRAQTEGAESARDGASNQRGGRFLRSSESDSKTGFKLNLPTSKHEQSEAQVPASKSGSSSSGSSPEPQEMPKGVSARKSSDEKDVADSETTYKKVEDIIYAACENVGAEDYERVYILPVYKALNLPGNSFVSDKLQRICGTQSSEGVETLLHRAAQCGALDIIELLIANGFAQYLNSEHDEAGQTPLSYAVGNMDSNLIQYFFKLSAEVVNGKSKNKIDHHNHLLCAAIYFYEVSRKKIEKVDRLIRSTEFQEGCKQLGYHELPSRDQLSLWCGSDIEYRSLLDGLGEDQSVLQRLLGNYFKEELKNEGSEENEDLSQLEDFCQAHGLNTQDVCKIYSEASQYNALFSILPTAFAKSLDTALSEGGRELESEIFKDRKNILNWLLENLAKSQSMLGSGWPFSLSPLQMCASFRDKEYFAKVLNCLPKKAPLDLPETEKTDKDGNSLLHLAVKGVNLAIATEEDFIRFIWKGYYELWNKVNNEDRSPLSIACLERNEPLIRLLAEQKIDMKVTQTFLAGQLLEGEAAKVLAGMLQKTSGDKVQSVTQEEKGQEYKIRLQLNGHRFPVGQKLERNKIYTSPLEDAANLGNEDVVALLLELWPEESCRLLTSKQGNPYLIALNLERSALLGSLAEDKKYNNARMQWGLVQDNIIRFIHRSDSDNGKENTRKSFVSGLFSVIRTEIKQVLDSNLRKSLSHMTDQLQSDYQHVITDVHTNKNKEYRDENILMINKIFYLLNELGVLASVAKMKNPSPEQLKKAKENFELSCSTKISSEAQTAWFNAVLWAFVGFAAGALIGLVVGTLLTGGGPGGIWLALPSAQYGSELGAIVGSVIGACVGGVSCVKVSDSFKWQRGLWAVNRAVTSIKADTQIHDESNQPLIGVKNEF
ncbi:MAG: ankyrin repeat domain-containing protein [Gammaproteobacteria bacterium]|nr:ankyrin repeat domain-containing protein [Gammaproteobacteria bacterium]